MATPKRNPLGLGAALMVLNPTRKGRTLREIRGNPFAVKFENTEIHTWFERDRAHVELRDKRTGETIFELWDNDVNAAVEEGFLNPKDYHGSMYDYAVHLGAVKMRYVRLKGGGSRAVENPSGPKCFVCGQPVSKRQHHAYFHLGQRTIYLHPGCDPQGKHQDRIMAAWERKHPEGKSNPGRRFHLQEAVRSGKVWQSYAPGSLHADPEAHAYWRGRMVAHELSARESPVENPSAAWHDRAEQEAYELRRHEILMGRPEREEYFAGMEQAQAESGAWGVLTARERKAQKGILPAAIGYMPRRRYNPSAAWHRKEMDESNRMSAYYHSAGMIKARDRQRGETAAHRQSAFIAPETSRSYHELEARLTREAGPRVAAPEDTQFPREYRAGYLAAHLHSAEEAKSTSSPQRMSAPVEIALKAWKEKSYFVDQDNYLVLKLKHGYVKYLPMISPDGTVSLIPQQSRKGFVPPRKPLVEFRLNPSPVEGARLTRLAGSPEASYRAFHQVNVDRRSKVKVPKGWPRKLWYLGRIVEAGVSNETSGYSRIMGGTLAVGPGGRKLYILAASGRLKAGVTARMGEIQYAPPKKSRKAFGGAYVHHFDNPPTVKSFGGGNYEIAGQGLKLTRRGIVG